MRRHVVRLMGALLMLTFAIAFVSAVQFLFRG